MSFIQKPRQIQHASGFLRLPSGYCAADIALGTQRLKFRCYFAPPDQYFEICVGAAFLTFFLVSRVSSSTLKVALLCAHSHLIIWLPLLPACS